MPFPSQNVRRSELKALPMRISQLQFDRLANLRDRDGLSMQEHVRRAIDAYLPRLERQAPPLVPASADDPSAAVPGSTSRRARPKLVRR